MGLWLDTEIPQPGSCHLDERWMPCLDHGLSTTGTNHPGARFQKLLLRRGRKRSPVPRFLIFSAQMVEKRNLRGMFRTSFGPRLLFFSSQMVEGAPNNIPFQNFRFSRPEWLRDGGDSRQQHRNTPKRNLLDPEDKFLERRVPGGRQSMNRWP